MDTTDTLTLLVCDVATSMALRDRVFPLAEADGALVHSGRSNGKALFEVTL